MDTTRLAELLGPFAPNDVLTSPLLQQLQRYLDLLLRWNQRVNLTAVRDPETIVTRHFGESLFAARVLLPTRATLIVADIGSGAGFPGIPMKLFAPGIELTLIESQNKKAVFLREVVRTLGLDHVDVFPGRAEQWGRTANLVTLRAVERFERALSVAVKLVADNGQLGLLIGGGQVPAAQQALGGWVWREPVLVPQSEARVILAGKRR